MKDTQTTLAPDVVRLVVAARGVLDVGHVGEEFAELDKAVEAFSERVKYENEPDDKIFLHVHHKCEHDFKGWRNFSDGSGGESVCTKCGIGAATASMREGL